MPENLLIKNTTLYYETGDSNKYDILIEEGRLVSITPAKDISHATQVIDATGYIAIPGLIDMHIHGAGGSDSLDGTVEAFTTISRTLAQHGTTSFLSAMVVKPGQYNQHLQAARECTGKDLGGAELLGMYIEGPFINAVKRGGIQTDSITEPSVAVLESLLEETGNALKMMCLAPEIPGNSEIIKRLLQSDVIPAFGHSNADYEETKKAFGEGIRHMTHFFNAMPSLHHRNPGPVAAAIENQDVSVELICDSHHLHPSLIRMVWKLKDLHNIVCITDGISAMGLPEGTYSYNNRKYSSKDGLARYLDGTLIGSTMSIRNIVKNFMNFTGSGLQEAIDTVTKNPARILGISDRKGSIEAGKDADIVLIDKSFNVHYTIIAGKPVYQNGK